MAECIIMGAGGGGVSSDEVTARAADVVAGKSYLGADTDDDVGVGTLVEREGEQPTTGVTISDGLAHVGMLPGAYRKSGRYGTPEVKAPVDMVARAAGLDGAKMLQG